MFLTLPPEENWRFHIVWQILFSRVISPPHHPHQARWARYINAQLSHFIINHSSQLYVLIQVRRSKPTPRVHGNIINRPCEDIHQNSNWWNDIFWSQKHPNCTQITIKHHRWNRDQHVIDSLFNLILMVMAVADSSDSFVRLILLRSPNHRHNAHQH